MKTSSSYQAPVVLSVSSLRLMLLATVLSAASCVNMTAIRDFAAISTDAAGYTSLTKDYVLSPRRQRIVEPESKFAELDRQSKERVKQQPGLIALHTGVSKYMSALASLAADEVVQFDTEVDSLTGALSKANISGVNAAEITAFGAITKLVAKAATDRYRQGHLKQMIQSCNASLQRVVKVMEFIVSQTYVESLELQKIALNSRYQTIQHQAADSGSESASLQLLKADVLQRLDDNEDKQNACQTYAKTLVKIREGHQKLYDNLGRAPNEEVFKQIKGYKNEVKTLFDSVKELTKQ